MGRIGSIIYMHSGLISVVVETSLSDIPLFWDAWNVMEYPLGNKISNPPLCNCFTARICVGGMHEFVHEIVQ